ncbi:MAG: cytochrome P450 [Steroidobacteraceae bacterium]
MANATSSTVPGHVSADRIFAFDMYADPRLKEDLHTGYASLLRDAPSVFYTPDNGGHWVITDYQIAAEILMDYEHFSAREMEIPRVAHPAGLIPLHMDPPASLAYRQILMPHFAPKAVREREEVMRQRAARLVATVADRGQCDFVREVSSRFPVTVFMEMMGLPLERFDEFRAIVDEFFRPVSEERSFQLGLEIKDEMAALIEQRRRERRNDLISHLLNARLEGRELNQQELESMCFLLVLAGMDTVTNAMSFAFRALGADPLLQARLHSRPESMSAFVEEALRLFGVVVSPRLVAKDCERYGVSFRRGDMVLCTNPVVGHDAKYNPDPEQIQLDRSRRTLLPFSIGPHLCLGHNLARSEFRILMEEWFKRIPRFQLRPDFKPTFRAGFVVALEALPLEWSVAGAANG